MASPAIPGAVRASIVSGPASGLPRYTESGDIWGGIVGVKGRVKFGDGNWFVPYYFDVGAGDSTLTWQSVLGVSHAFRWGEGILAYRYLSYEQGGNKLVEDLSFAGFGLGVNFRF
jgi:hypothetical protein